MGPRVDSTLYLEIPYLERSDPCYASSVKIIVLKKLKSDTFVNWRKSKCDIR